MSAITATTTPTGAKTYENVDPLPQNTVKTTHLYENIPTVSSPQNNIEMNQCTAYGVLGRKHQPYILTDIASATSKSQSFSSYIYLYHLASYFLYKVCAVASYSFYKVCASKDEPRVIVSGWGLFYYGIRKQLYMQLLTFFSTL